MRINSLFTLITISVLFTACGTQKRLATATERSQTAKEHLANNNKQLTELESKVAIKLNNKEMDTSINTQIASIINKLKQNLDSTQRTIDAIDFFLNEKKNFRPKLYESSISPLVSQLDSFELQKKTRDRIYQLLTEAVDVKAVERYHMGAFFEPGIYRMAPKTFNDINKSFSPAIDSIAALSNRFADIKRTAYLVIVGYADATRITPGTALYNELKYLIKVDNPQNSQLNQKLSDLRSQELLRYLKLIMQNNASKFKNYNQLRLGYLNYGRGEELPFKNLKNYTDNDERRRVVVFYWTILPTL